MACRGRNCRNGMIATWGGHAGQGGRVGPCPVCNVEAARRFRKSLTFIKPKEEKTNARSQ